MSQPGASRTRNTPSNFGMGKGTPDVPFITPEVVLPGPDQGTRPTVYADHVGSWYVNQKTEAHRKQYGLYLTSVMVADFMARPLRVDGDRVRILDPAAGTGILSCAAVESLVSQSHPPSQIEITAYEVDAGLIRPLTLVLEYLATWCRMRGVELTLLITHDDFVLRHSEALQRMGGLIPYKSRQQGFDIVITNPPYFKISKADPRAVAASCVVHGQPNIYAIFMAVGAALLRVGGQFVFIIPRSFTSGPYFHRFRQVFLDTIRPHEIHIFASRRDTFSRDAVLQENVILRGIREEGWHLRNEDRRITISSSHGVDDLDTASRRTIPMTHALSMNSADRVIRLPTHSDDEILALVDSWPCSLRSLGLAISTGPVIPFRATELVMDAGRVPDTHAPLIWMNHVKPMAVSWPLDKRKAEYIRLRGAEALLVPNSNYVLLRRFSSKEEARRLTAAPYLATCFKGSVVGLENHLNYIYRPGGSLSEDEVWGLSVLYNSSLLDNYFRCVSGNTQASATELRAMPLPRLQTIIDLGRRARSLPDLPQQLDSLVMGMVVLDEQEADVG